MIKWIANAFIILLLSPWAQGASDLRENLAKDIQDGRLNDWELIEAAWIISNVNSPDSLAMRMAWYRNILEEVRTIGFIDLFNKTSSAEKLFYFLHTHHLKTYKEAATTLVDIMDRQEYNCVSATVLYNLLCADLGLHTEAFETPTHVYTIFTNFAEQVMVENTSSMGFNIMKNLQAYSQYLASYYPENQVLQIGLDRLWAYEQSRGRRINNTELLGLICYNQAYFARKAGHYQQSYEFVLLAQLFNSDSRSNQRFEINLYYEWGRKQFNAQQFDQAFQVFADGYYRYPDNSDFRKYCILSFFQAVEMDWQDKNWPATVERIYEILDLSVLSNPERNQIQNLLSIWARYHAQNRDESNFSLAVKLLKEEFAAEKLARELEPLLK